MTAQFSLGSIALTAAATSSILIGSTDTIDVEGNKNSVRNIITMVSSQNTKKEKPNFDLVSPIASLSVTVFGLCGLAAIGYHYKEKNKKKK